MNGPSIDVTITARLALTEKKYLVIGLSQLSLHDPVAKKAQRNSCAPFVSDESAKLSVPISSVLWAELVNNNISVDYVQSYKNTHRHENWHFEIQDYENDSTTTASSSASFVENLLAQAYGPAQRQRRAYVLINPNAGPGGALRKWTQEVKPLFDAARLETTVVVLEKGCQATELVVTADLDKYDTIMALSGDGTLHEIFNGLAQRPDARRALASIAVSHIPCGSGNAMACNLYGPGNATAAALAIIKGIIAPLDLISITQGDRRYVSFLSQSLGVIAESDLATEHLRWMGSTRFDYGIATRVFRKQCYPCDLAVKVVAEEKSEVKSHYRRYATVEPLEHFDTIDGGGAGLPNLKYGTIKDELPAGWELIHHDKVGSLFVGNMAWITPKDRFFCAALPSDGCMDLAIISGDMAPMKTISTLLAVGKGTHFDLPHLVYKKISAYRVIPRNQEDGYISVDGEKVPFEPYQAEIHRGLGRVISKRTNLYEAEGPPGWEFAEPNVKTSG